MSPAGTIRQWSKKLEVSPSYRLRITTQSAALLDALLDDEVAVEVDLEEESLTEGTRRDARHQTIERSSVVRARALALHGTVCAVCKFSFADRYGESGEGFIEVHHLVPLGDSAGPVLVTPALDVVVLCANCHRMVRTRRPPLTPDALVAAMNEVAAAARA